MKLTNHKSIKLQLNETGTDEYFFPDKVSKIEVIKPDPWEIYSTEYRAVLIDVNLLKESTSYNPHYLPDVLHGENVNRMSTLGRQMARSKKMYAPIFNLRTKRFDEGRHRYWYILKMRVSKMIVAIYEEQLSLIDLPPFVLECSDGPMSYDKRMFSDTYPEYKRLIKEHMDYFNS